MVDAPDLGSGAARREGSSPFTRTIFHIHLPFFIACKGYTLVLGTRFRVKRELIVTKKCIEYPPYAKVLV